MEKDLQSLGKVLKNTRMVDSKSLEVHDAFKESLREQLFKKYIDDQRKGGIARGTFGSFFQKWRILLYIFFIVVFLGLIGTGAYLLTKQSPEQTPTPVVTQKEVLIASNVVLVDGDVEYKKSDDDRWVEVKKGDTLKQGDSIRTGNGSRVVLELDNGNAVRLDSSSEVLLLSMDPDAVVIEQMRGESYNRVSSSKEHTHTVKAQDVEVEALGTAYIVESKPKKQKVSVFVYESKVKVRINGDEKSVKELKKAVIEVKEKKLTILEMSQQEYKRQFASWNMNQDKKMGYETHEKVSPVVAISSPTSGIQTEASEIAVTGTVTDESALKKIILNGTIYTSKDEYQKGFNPVDGTFDVTVPLEVGENVISVEAYDIYWNVSDVVSVTVTRTIPEPVVPPPSSEISVSAQALGNLKVKITITTTTDAQNGFKIAWSQTNSIPKYPDDSWTYTGGKYGPGTYSFEVSIKESGTYYLGASIWEGVGGESGLIYGSTGQIQVT